MPKYTNVADLKDSKKLVTFKTNSNYNTQLCLFVTNTVRSSLSSWYLSYYMYSIGKCPDV